MKYIQIVNIRGDPTGSDSFILLAHSLFLSKRFFKIRICITYFIFYHITL